MTKRDERGGPWARWQKATEMARTWGPIIGGLLHFGAVIVSAFQG